MGKTAFGGPLYGAKANLLSFAQTLGSTGASSHLDARTVVPPGEDWYITEFSVGTSTNSSGGATWKLKSEGGSSGQPRYQGQPSTVAQTLATIDAGASTSLNSQVQLTPTAGEYEGVYVPTGSTVRVVSSGAGQPSALTVVVSGYRRWLSSTRAEA